MSKRAKWTLLGFCLFILGMSALTIQMVGLQYGFLAWMESLGRLPSFLLKLGMIVAGLVMVALANAAKEEDYDEFFDGGKKNGKQNH